MFPSDPHGFPGVTGPRSLAFPGSSSRELSLLSRVINLLKPARRPQPPSAFLGVSSPIRGDNARSPLNDGLPISHLRSAPGVSHTLDGLLLLTPRGPISSHNHVRDSLCRDFPRHSADLTHRQSVLSWPSATIPFAAELPRPHQVQKFGLQSLNPSADPLTLMEFLHPPKSRSPLELSNPSGLAPRTLAAPSRSLRS